MLSGYLISLILAVATLAQAEASTQVVLLGTGNPVPDPEKSGPAVAVVSGGQAYLVDFGPGVVRRANAAHLKTGLRALRPENIGVVFSTHLHSDHTAGYPDLILTPWVMGRRDALKVFGPPGIKSMTEHILEAYKADIDMRVNGLERSSPVGVRVDAVEIEAGVVYRGNGVTVEAIAIDHGNWEAAFGYKFVAPDKTVVISGDTGPSRHLVEKAKGCDVLVHEVYAASVLQQLPAGAQAYHSAFHTSGVELGKLAAEIEPGLLVLYHQLSWSPKDVIIEEVRQNYDGPLAYGEDLDVY